MNKNLQSPTALTEFAPLSPEPDDSPGISQLLTKLFKRSSNNAPAETKQSQPTEAATRTELPEVTETRWQDNPEFNKEPHSDSSSLSGGDQYRLEVTEGRSLPNVLKRISNLLALKSSGLQAYKDTELKQYWMPDSVSKECYDCGEKFTTFRRKHHCRVCGQIFCSRCCNQEIPGKIMGCTGDLRVCTYCGKVVLSYLQSADMGADLSSDLRALQEDLQTKFGDSDVTLFPPNPQPSLAIPAAERDDVVKRKPSVGYQEEKFIQARQYTRDEHTSPLQSLMCELSHPTCGLTARLGYGFFTASQLIDWLMLQNRATIRSQGVAIGQALLETGYIESLSPDTVEFQDNIATFRLRAPPSPSPSAPPSSDELWPVDPPTTDSESECVAAEATLPSSASLFRLDLNLEDSTVHISRPLPSSKRVKVSTGSTSDQSAGEGLGDTVVRAMVQSYRESSREPGQTVNWHSVPPQSLRVDNGERQTFLALSGAFQQHLGVLVKQLLNSEGVAQSWADTVLPLAQQVVASVRPDPRSDCDEMDIRQYVQLKKVSGGSRSDSCIVGGVVCSKNLAHRAMPAKLANPRILLLSCAIVYQRIEGRLMSLEPVMMQEQEYLRHTVARIAAMAPDLVLVQRNVSRLAQENLLRLGISLVLNVKPSVLDRVARMTGADIVKSIDAQVGRPQLGTCTSFYVQSFTTDTGATKTLMFLEGCLSPHLGCTVLLRGASTVELAKLKRVTSWLIYALYNWRLEFSYLMDEFAEPPTLGDDNFFQDDDHSPKKEKLATSSPLNDNFINSQSMQQLRNSGGSRSPSVKRVKSADKENRESDESLSERSRLSGKEKSISDERRMNVESVSDFSDPLHLYMNLDDDVFKKSNNGQALSVSEPAKSNRFRKALDDTLLSISPFLKFSVPYLETESGRNCLLRRYFPKQVYWTAQLQDQTMTRPTLAAPEMSNKDALLKLNGVKLGPVHPFITAKLTEPANSHSVQTMLAFYRACGGRLPLPPLHKPLVPPTPAPAPIAPTPATPTDALDPAKHQRLAVLFCSYSHESHNAPSFCVNPWVVHMDYYGRNDIPLGAFLERYCFRSSYTCQSDRCDTPMLKHVRRFVHEGGAVQISLREIEGAPHTDDDSILMWTYCPTCNQQVSQVMRMSPDTWSFSFAKFLELHFHAGLYTVRGSDCTHSIHQACRQFFGHKNMVAYFQQTWLFIPGDKYQRQIPHVASRRYEKISVWEISLPPLLLVTQPTTQAAHQDEILEEVKRWALNGYEVFSAILNRLCTLASNGEAGAMVMKQQLQKEQTMFKGRVEEIQMRLTSPTHMCQPPSQGQTDSVWQLEDSLVLLKRSIAEAVAEWNVRLSEAETAHSARKREEKNKKSGQDIKTNLSTSAGLSEIIDGQPLASQGYDIGETAASRRSLPSQSSLHSATDVVDDALASAEDTIFTVDACEVDVLDSPAGAVVKPTEDSAPTMAPETTVPTSSSSELISESEEVHEHTSMEQDIQPDEDVDVNTNRDSHSSKHPHQLTDRVSVKQILSQLLPKDTPANPLQCPMSPQEHHTLPLGAAVPVVVYEREPSSIISYALSCHDYRTGLEDLRAKRISLNDQPLPSPMIKRKSGSMESKDATLEPSPGVDSRKAGVLSFLRTTSSSGSLSQGGGAPGETAGTPPDSEEVTKTDSEPTKPKTSKDKPSPHLEVQFSDSTANFIVKIYYAEEFARLRATIFPAGEDAFVRSLSRCVQWAARGGKSGSNFAKTKDDRFILKEMSRTETHPFMDSAPQYFDYMDRCAAAGSPSLLGKIVGVYRVIYRSTTSNATFRSNLLVMENLFYNRSVRHKFDLKGSVRNRLVNPLEQGGEIVLLDENLINMTCDNPLYILPHSKTVLMQAIQSDTQFLATQAVMDYSLLVGLDETNKELVVGIIDYIRTFTWDKRLETMVKKSGLLGGQGKLPTIVSPDEYRDRFIAAMHRYFLPVPDRWTGLGKGLDF